MEDDPYKPPASGPSPDAKRFKRRWWHFILWFLPAPIGLLIHGAVLTVILPGPGSGYVRHHLFAEGIAALVIYGMAGLATWVTADLDWRSTDRRKRLKIAIWWGGLSALNLAIAFAGCTFSQ